MLNSTKIIIGNRGAFLERRQTRQTPLYLFSIGRLEFKASRPVVPPKDHTEVGLYLSGKAESVVVPPAMKTPFGPTMERLICDLRVMGAVPDVRIKSAVAAWNKESGVVEFDKLDMNWGPLVMTARGTMGFDDDLQPEGAFASVVSNHEAVLKSLSEAGFIAASQSEMLNSALALFAHSADKGASSGIEIPIAVQLGGLFLGPVRIYAFPEIVWQEGQAQ